jgi:voltage-gated potassium channel
MFWAWLYYHRFDLLLGTLLIFILIGPYIEYDLGPINVPHVLIMTINVAAVGAARGTRRHLRASLLLVLLSFLCSALPYSYARELSILLDLLLAAYTAASILRYALRVPAVTRNVIVAAICVYLQIGLIFARLYFFVDQATHATAIVNGNLAVQSMPELVYFSFTTLTTTGFGDMHPAVPLARSLCVLEAILGQLYIVILIGRLVGLSIVHAEIIDGDR